MEIKAIHSIYFSPAHSTRKIVKAIAEGISEANPVFHHDLTRGSKTPVVVGSDEIAVIGIPVYAGRVPELATKYISEVKAAGTPAIIVCVYGNREYEDALLELNNLSVSCGFTVIGAGAFIARHSIFPKVAEGRPDQNDLAKAVEFGKQSLDIFTRKGKLPITIKGNIPYRAANSVPLSPTAGRKCDKCGVCAVNCPSGAINKENPKATDPSKCIACAGCIEVCPQKARRFRGVKYKLASNMFFRKYAQRKEIELFLPE